MYCAYFQSKSSSQPLPTSKIVCEPNISTFYSQGTFDDELPCSQDFGGYLEYQQQCMNSLNNVQEVKKPSEISKKSLKKKTCSGKNKACGSGLNSYIIKQSKKGVRLIKISISNLEADNESEEVAVQYIVESEYDDVLNSTEGLVDKIVKRLSNANYSI
jgi:hypothetical protein